MAWHRHEENYINLTSCKAVRTSLAVAEEFPEASVSEDCHTWMRYGAHPGKFAFLREIKGGYRIRRGIASRSRALNKDFYARMFKMDTDGLEQALKKAKKFNTMSGYSEDELRLAFHVRLALKLLHGGSKDFCKVSLLESYGIDKDLTLHYIDLIKKDIDTNTKRLLKSVLP